jgi:glutathione S-transferase
MEKSIGDKPFCCGIYFTLADIATGCALSYLDFRFPELAWRQHAPKLNQLMIKLEQRPCFIETKPS